MKYKAVIWDCDGVLIDSEALACQASCDLYKEIGCNVTLKEYLSLFLGMNRKQVLGILKEKFGLNEDLIEADFWKRKDARRRKVFESDLQPIDGIEHVLKTIDLPMAVASGSNYKRLIHSLDVTSLTSLFSGHIYSSEMVENGKPAPDVFLHAAKKLGVDPRDCLVVEDGIHGINAAIAAGMDVVAYLGGSHMTEGLKQSVFDVGLDNIIYDIRDLLQILKVELKEAC